VLDAPTSAPGLEWGLATDYVPHINVKAVHQWLDQNGAWDNIGTDLYALVTPNEDVEADLLRHPHLAMQVPRTQHDRLAAALAEDEDDEFPQ
jgi:hypothetical protein